jgi:hypothetical protein
MLGHPASNNTSSTNGNMHFNNNYDEGFMVISQNNNKNANLNNNNNFIENNNFNSIKNHENDNFPNPNSNINNENFNNNKNLNHNNNQKNFDFPKKNEEKIDANAEGKSAPALFVRPIPGNKASSIPAKFQNAIANRTPNDVNYNQTIDIGELTNEQNLSCINADNKVNSSYNGNLTENEIENSNDSCNISASATNNTKENENPCQM